MKFHFTINDNVDLGILHETLLHLMTEHPPLVMEITVEFDTPVYEFSTTPETTASDNDEHQASQEWSNNSASNESTVTAEEVEEAEE